MALLTLEQLTTPLTKEEIQATIYAVMAKVGLHTTGWKPGAVARTIVTGVSVLGASLSQILAGLNKSRFLELAEEGWAEQVGHYDYGTDRDDARFATGQATLTNTGGGLYEYDPDDLTIKNTAKNKTYRNTEAITLGPGTLEEPTSVTFGIQATEVGSASNALPGEIDALESSLTGVSVTNAESVVGTDQEALPTYKERCLAQPDTNSTGGLEGSYLYWANRATRPDGSSLGITRVKVVQNSDTGDVTVYCATASGTVGETDLQILDDTFQRYVLPIPAKLHVYSAVATVEAVTYTAWVYKSANLTTDALKSLVLGKLAAFVAELPIGGHVYGGHSTGEVPLNSFEAAIQSARAEIFKVAVTTPSADRELEFSQALSLGTVTGTVNWV